MHHNTSLNPFLFQFVRFFFVFTPIPCLLMLFVIFRRKLYREIPWFTILLFETVVASVIFLVIWQFGTWNQYFVTSWVERGVTVVLDFMVILDIVRSLFGGYPSLRRLLVSVLVFAGIALVVIAVSTAPFSLQQFSEQNTRAPFILTVDRGLSMVQTGLIVALFGVSWFLGLSWRNYLFGIPFGYGLYATSRLYLVALFMTVPPFFAKVMIATAVSAMLMQIVWLSYFLVPDPVPALKFKPAAAADLERWNAALNEYLAG